MRQAVDREFAAAKEIAHIVRSFRAVLAAHVLKYRAVEGIGAVAAFAADVERDSSRYENKFRGIREPSLASFAKMPSSKSMARDKGHRPGQGIGRSRNNVKTTRKTGGNLK